MVRVLLTSKILVWRDRESTYYFGFSNSPKRLNQPSTLICSWRKLSISSLRYLTDLPTWRNGTTGVSTPIFLFLLQKRRVPWETWSRSAASFSLRSDEGVDFGDALLLNDSLSGSSSWTFSISRSSTSWHLRCIESVFCPTCFFTSCQRDELRFSSE